MKDLIIGFEFGGTRYGAHFVFTIREDLGVVISECRELISFNQPDPLTGPAKDTLLELAGKEIIPLLQAHIMKEYDK